MAKKSIVARDAKRIKMIDKYAAKRKELKELGDQEGLANLPRNSSPTRRTNRCVETGRSRSLHAPVRLEPSEFPRACRKGRNTRSNEVELVGGYMSSTTTDPIADMLTRIRNAIAVRKVEVSLPHSQIKESVARLLQENNFVDAVSISDAPVGKTLTVKINDEVRQRAHN